MASRSRAYSASWQERIETDDGWSCTHGQEAESEQEMGPAVNSQCLSLSLETHFLQGGSTSSMLHNFPQTALPRE